MKKPERETSELPDWDGRRARTTLFMFMVTYFMKEDGGRVFYACASRASSDSISDNSFVQMSDPAILALIH